MISNKSFILGVAKGLFLSYISILLLTAQDGSGKMAIAILPLPSTD
ncbi:MAG: hypothetical protein UU67_C0050G0001 [Candidatus Daviesbacteria bacterium GW2011_GWB1_41_5]|uniref:Uncharacterized protein n=1 Tax=Candidatus Daviesbacteria bacterium GW2011_GWB1_41_5 TaxID=1618429 RepID=A0A0G0YS92_9BACT|nr:MAG: hypothetical protein UU67_C0050G0001 [Candidatus Daviesbacteria bacterium GW2011_GWB1_41_5]